MPPNMFNKLIFLLFSLLLLGLILSDIMNNQCNACCCICYSGTYSYTGKLVHGTPPKSGQGININPFISLEKSLGKPGTP